MFAKLIVTVNFVFYAEFHFYYFTAKEGADNRLSLELKYIKFVVYTYSLGICSLYL